MSLKKSIDGAHLWLVLWKTARAVEAYDRASIAATGLGLSDFAVLEVLLHKGPLPVNTIGRKVLLTSGSITTAVDRLEARALVLRRASREDRRVTFVELTARGRSLIGKAFQSHARRLDELAQPLPASERRSLVRSLRALGRRAESLYAVPVSAEASAFAGDAG